MNTKILNIISLVIAIIITLVEFQWLGKSDLAIIIIGLSVAIGLNSLAQLIRK